MAVDGADRLVAARRRGARGLTATGRLLAKLFGTRFERVGQRGVHALVQQPLGRLHGPRRPGRQPPGHIGHGGVEVSAGHHPRDQAQPLGPVGGHELGPQGGGVSAGEGQLLAFARAFLTDPGLVVLDEASSRLDPFTGERIASATRSLLAGRTAVVIAHRLETLAEVDEIAVLENGRLVEHGDRARLAADADSRYARLLRTAEHGLLRSDAASPALADSDGPLGARQPEEATA